MRCFHYTRGKSTISSAGQDAIEAGPFLDRTGVRVALGGKMSRRAIAFATLLFLSLFPVLGSGTIGPKFLIHINLEQREAFDRAARLGLEPVYRWGNEFYVVVDGLGLDQLDQAGLQYTVAETNPFATGYYFVDSKAPFTEPGGLAKLGAQPLDLIGGGTLWKSDEPLLWKAQLAGEEPFEITGEKIPLIYMATMTSSGIIPTDPIFDTIVARVSQDSLVAYDARLMNFRTRYSYSDSNLAAQNYLMQKFLSFGYTDIKTDTFVIDAGRNGNNVICTKHGTTDPEKYIIVCAHYDSQNQRSDPMVWAPGADDNGSGTAGVLEIARAFANIPTRKTVIFIAFGAEEQGLVGSDYYSGIAAANGWDIELVLNMDMLGWNPDVVNNVWVYTDPASMGYAILADQLAQTRTSLIPSLSTAPSGSSDHAYFGYRGYRFLFAIEGDFNAQGWHTDLDSLSRLNPPYWTDIVRMMGMTGYYASKAPSPVPSAQVWDVGDGQSLELRWQEVLGADIAAYRVYYGTATGQYTASVDVPAGGLTTTRLNGLMEGVRYYTTIITVDTAGTESVVGPEVNEVPFHAPRVPNGFLANVMRSRIDLTWYMNFELDFDHYTIYRGLDSTLLSVLVPSIATTSYSDADVVGRNRYYYRVVAVDRDGNASSPSNLVSGIPATFDQGLLLADFTSSTNGNPTDAEQWNVYNTVFADYAHGFHKYTENAPFLDKSDLGQYGSLYWIDDDYQWENWLSDHWAKLNWYLSNATDLAVIGWATPNEVRSAGALYDLAHVSGISRINDVDCIGGIGVSGFPSVIFDTAKVFPPDNLGTLYNIWTMTPADGSAETILQYNSAIDDPTRESKTVAVRYNSGTSKVAFVGLPLYQMRNQDAEALVTAINDWFGLAQHPMGDLNSDGVVNVLDVIILIRVAFQGQTPPNGMASVDVNGDCIVDVKDVIYMINYVFLNGPAAGPGCAS